MSLQLSQSSFYLVHAMLNCTLLAGASVVFVNETDVSCEEPGEKVWRPGGAAIADAGTRVILGTS